MCSPTVTARRACRHSSRQPEVAGGLAVPEVEQLPRPPCDPETNSEPYSPAFAIGKGQMARLTRGPALLAVGFWAACSTNLIVEKQDPSYSQEARPRWTVREREGLGASLRRAGRPAETWFQALVLILSECFYSVYTGLSPLLMAAVEHSFNSVKLEVAVRSGLPSAAFLACGRVSQRDLGVGTKSRSGFWRGCSLLEKCSCLVCGNRLYYLTCSKINFHGTRYDF